MGDRVTYEVFGLGVSSEIPIPEFVESGSAADVRISLGSVDWAPPSNAFELAWSRVQGSEACLYWQGVGKFLVRHGTDIIVDPDPEASQDRLRLFLTGAAFGVLLHQRGLLVLHASAVSIDDAAVAFLGTKGGGKSTVAALLHARGHRLIADDVLAVQIPGGIPVVIPSYPQIKLWPESLDVLGKNASELSRLHPQLKKLSYPVPETFCALALPLHSAYVLDRGTELSCEALETQDALAEVMGHWYCGRFDYQSLHALGIRSQFVQSADLVSKVPFYLLRRPQELTAMPEVASLVEQTVARDLERSRAISA